MTAEYEIHTVGPDDCILAIRYPLNLIETQGITITSDKVDLNSVLSLTTAEQGLNYALKANSNGLQITYGDSRNILILKNVEEDVKAGRRFRLVLTGFTAVDVNTLESNNIEVLVYWKNTYSVLS